MLLDTIETDRLILRAPRLSDAEPIFRSYAQDAEVTRYLMWSPHRSIEETRGFLEESIAVRGAGRGWPCVITLADSEEPVGMIDGRPDDGLVAVGYVLARRWWGRGYMTEALAAFTTGVLSLPGIGGVRATCDQANVGSVQVLENCDYLESGTGRTMFPAFGDEPRACVVYERRAASLT
jgi:RimJ/RimL family protein N-acetyltransferase